MLDTETRVRTATQQDLFSSYHPIAPTTDKIMAPEFKPFSFGTEVPTEEITQTPAFEVEKQYSFDTQPYQKEEQTEAVMEMPTVDREQQIVASRREETQIVAKARLNARGKIIVAVYSVIVAIIVAFCIYNAVAINGMQSTIAGKEQIVATQTQVITDLQNTYNELGGEDYITSQVGGSFKKPTASDIVAVEGFEMVERPEEVSQTNWFEDFCQALRRLFS